MTIQKEHRSENRCSIQEEEDASYYLIIRASELLLTTLRNEPTGEVVSGIFDRCLTYCIMGHLVNTGDIITKTLLSLLPGNNDHILQ